MKLVILNAGADTAGCGIGLKRAFDKYADGWEARAICRSVPYFEYPTDIVWPREEETRPPEVARLVQEADVIHVMDHQFALGQHPREDLQGKLLVVHHLGTNYRRRPSLVSMYCRRYGAVQVTDSIDLMDRHVRWLPITTDIEAIAELRQAYRPSSTVRIAHAPTNRKIKSTEFITETVERIADRYPVTFDLIEGVTNAECLRRKAQADIFIDQLKLGFGLNFIECAAMGIPVVSGWANRVWRQRTIDLWGNLPWADATRETLEAVITRLVIDATERREIGEHGREHVRRWHSEEAVVRQTLAVYERAGLRIAA